MQIEEKGLILPFMKKIIPLILALILVVACGKSEDEKAAPQLARIEKLYQEGHYQAALDSISSLRQSHPKALKSRARALEIWQDASLKMSQEDIGRTDSALQATQQALAVTNDIGQRNRLAVRRDSLQARYDALCAIVRKIHKLSGKMD